MVNTYEGKISYFVALTKSMVKDGYKAGDMIKTINQVTNGRGGGKARLCSRWMSRRITD